MSCFNKYKWELVPGNLPVVKRNCPKCKEKTNYINAEKFRVNANKNNIDVWLIYKCEKCKSTWNMSIYERVNPKDITKKDYERFIKNDKEFAKKYGFDISIHLKNKAELVWDNVFYKVNKEKIEEDSKNKESIITITCDYPLEIRIDKFLSDNLNISRSKVKEMFEKGYIFSDCNKKLMKSKITSNMNIHILLVDDIQQV